MVKTRFIILTGYILGKVAVGWSCVSRVRENNVENKLLILYLAYDWSRANARPTHVTNSFSPQIGKACANVIIESNHFESHQTSKTC